MQPIRLLRALLVIATCIAGCALDHPARVDGGRPDSRADADARLDAEDIVVVGMDAPDGFDVVMPDVPDGCTGDACPVVCTAGMHACGGVCVSNMAVASCGTSCTPCPAAPHSRTTCDGTTCGLSCETGFQDCDRAAANGCEDNLSTGLNCGVCGRVCSGGTPMCSSTGTGFACVSGCGGATPTLCGANCVDLMNNSANCGACGNVCPAAGANATASCATSVCGSVCNAGFHRCGGACVSNVDPATCAGSCMPCLAPAGGFATCDGTRCGTACSPGMHDCTGNCVSNASVASCGSSCTACSLVADAVPTCNGTTCGFTCNPGFMPSGGMCVAVGCTPTSCNARARALTSPVSGRYTGTTVGAASTESGSCGGSGAPEAVFIVTFSVPVDLFVTTHGTGFDTVLYLRRDCCSSTEVTCNNDADGRTTSVLRQTNLAAGTYYIFVDGVGGASGAFTLDIQATGTGGQAGDHCSRPLPLRNSAVTGTTCGFGDDADPTTCGTTGRMTSSDVIYYFVLDAPGNVTLSTCAGATCVDSVLHVRDECNVAATERACNDDSCRSAAACSTGPYQSSLTVRLNAGIHYLYADQWSGSGCGTYTLTPTGIP